MPDQPTPQVRFRFRVACRPEPPAELDPRFWSDHIAPDAELDAERARQFRRRCVLATAPAGTTLLVNGPPDEDEAETIMRPDRLQLVGVLPAISAESWTPPVRMTVPAERAVTEVLRLAQWTLRNVYGHQGAADHIGSIAVPGLELSIEEVTG